MNRKQRRALKARKVKMPNKTEEEIKQEYFQLCAQAGELQYKIEEFKGQLVQLNIKISELNQAYSKQLADKTSAAPQTPQVEGGMPDVQPETESN